MADVPEAKFRISAETSQAEAALRKFTGGMSKEFDLLGKAAGFALAAFSVSSVISFAKAAFEAADAVGDMAERAGVAVESFSRLKFAAEQNDVEVTSLAVGIKTLQKNLSEATSGSEDAADKFAMLHLSASELKELSLEEQFGRIADAFQKIPNPADRSRIAVDLFGKSGQELVPLLLQGSDGIARLTAKADELGITLSTKTAKSIDESDKALKALNSTMSAFFARMAGGVALSLGFGEDTSPVGVLKKQIADLEAARAPILESLKQGATFSPDSSTIKYFDQLNEKIGQAMLRLESLQKLQAGVVSGGHGAIKANVSITGSTDGLEEFTSPLLQNQLTGGAAIAAQADKELKASQAEWRKEAEQAEFDSYVRRLQGAQQWKEGVESIFADVGANFAAEQEAEANKLIEIAGNKLKTQTEFEEEEAERRRRIVEYSLSDISSLMSTNNKTLFKIGKAAAIANATLSAKEGIMNAFATKPWYLGVALGAAAAAKLYSEISQLKSVEMSGYMSGGYTGDGARDDIAGVVHRGEYVMDAATTTRLGKSNLDAMRRGESGSNTNLVIENHGTPQRYERTKGLTAEEIRYIARDEVHSQTPGVVATELSNPNSRISKSIGRNTQAARRR